MDSLIDSGVEELNNILGGGFIEGSVILLFGPVGSLKGYLGDQFIYAGLRAGERCLYISTWRENDEFVDQLRRNFGWDLEPYIRGGMLKFLDLTSFWLLDPSKINENVDMSRIYEAIFEAKERMHKGRILFSNLSHLLTFTSDRYSIIRLVFSIKVNAKRSKSTVMFIMDEGAQDKHLEEDVKSICDYVLVTKIVGKERKIKVLRALTKHGLEWYNLMLRDDGIKLRIVV